MSDLKAIEVYQLSAEFSAPLREFLDFYKELLDYMHSTEVTVRQVMKAMVACGELPQ
jgi:uncharacterized protein Usg